MPESIAGRSRALRVVLMEEDPRDAELIAALLGRDFPDGEVLRVDGEAGFRSALGGFRPDVVLADDGSPAFPPLDALRLTQLQRPAAAFILVSGSFGERAAEALKSGAADFIPKTDLGRLSPAIESALEQRASLRSLSERQLDVVQRLGTGSSMREIAARLSLSLKTVESHRSEAMKRLGVRDLVGLVRYAIRLGLVSPME